MKYHGLIIILFALTLAGFACNESGAGQKNYKNMRMEMVENQIIARGITDPEVVTAMQSVPRHRFVPEKFRSAAYADTPLPIGEGQTISQPYMVAYMTRALELKPDDKVLEIGTGSGYQAAVLAEICDSVFTIEIFESLANHAKTTLDNLGYDNVYIRHGDGYKGWPSHAQYDAIIVTCSPHKIPRPLENQLAEGGRMIIPVDEGEIQNLYLLHKIDGEIETSRVLPVRFVPMIKEDGTSY